MKPIRVTAWVDVYPHPEATDDEILDAVRRALRTKTDTGIELDCDAVTIDYDQEDT